MLCVEVLINGERRTTAGLKSAECIEATVATIPGLEKTWLRVSGDVLPESQPPADAHWLTMDLSVGDKVEMHIIETDNPDAPKLSRFDPKAAASDEIPYVCAFCGKDPRETEGMISSPRAMICRGCVLYLYQVISEEDVNTSV